MDGEFMVLIPGKCVVLLIVGVILNLDGDHFFKGHLSGGVTERHPGAVHVSVAYHAVGVVGLREIATFRPLTNFVKHPIFCYHMKALLTAISAKAIGLTVVIAKLNIDSWMLNR